MASLGCLLVCAFGNFLGPVLVAAHTANNSRVLKIRPSKLIKQTPKKTSSQHFVFQQSLRHQQWLLVAC